jgi:hypothetical protein
MGEINNWGKRDITNIFLVFIRGLALRASKFDRLQLFYAIL